MQSYTILVTDEVSFESNHSIFAVFISNNQYFLASFLIIVTAAATIQAIYHMIWLIGFINYHPSHLNPQPASVVIAARNEYKNLPDLISQLQAQEHPEFEIIIVNDRSSDDTFDYLNHLQKSNPNIRMVNIDHKPDNMDGKKYALTLGIKAAKYPIIILTDADCHIESSKWLLEMSSSFESDNTEIVLGASIYEGGSGLLGAFAKYESLYTAIQYLGFALIGMPYMGVGRNLAYRKSLFTDSKGYKGYLNVTGGDDDLFVNRHANSKNIGVRIGKAALTKSKPKKTWSSYYIQKNRHLSVGKKYKFKHQLILAILSFSHLLFYPSLIAGVYFTQQYYLLAGVWALRTIILYITFIKASGKIGITFKPFALLFLDFIYVFYYLSAGLKAIFTKKVRWS